MVENIQLTFAPFESNCLCLRGRLDKKELQIIIRNILACIVDPTTILMIQTDGYTL